MRRSEPASGAAHRSATMDDHVLALAGRGAAINVVVHQAPLSDEVPGQDYDIAGIITEDWLTANTLLHQADYYICGPRPFLRHAVAVLAQAGVPAERVHYKFFGPADELLAA